MRSKLQIAQNIDSPEALLEHRKLLEKKRFLKKLYTDFYRVLAEVVPPKGKVVELGSGAGFIKDILPQAITSDVLAGQGIDKVFPAEKMPFAASSLTTIIMIDVLHHVKDPEKALREMERCLVVGGKIIMIEPYNSLWGGFIYRYFHYEHFDPAAASWKISGEGRMSDTNSALPWIMFVRDREIFEKKFPRLGIVRIQPHTPFRYLISGGLRKWQLLPTFTYGCSTAFEGMLAPFNPLLGMFVTIELEKTK